MNAPQATAVKFKLTAPVTITPPQLNDGERWAGIVTTEKGLHHIILLPGDQDGAPWKKQMVWAKKAGGDLPDRVELATLRRTLLEEFQSTWYWSCEQHAAHSDYAWCQTFDHGTQYNYGLNYKLRARAVRRLIIE